MQAIVAKLHKLHAQNLSFRQYRRNLINENKWRAARDGINAKLIDFGKEAEVPFKELVIELLDFIDDVLDELGSRKEVEYVHQILANGTGADRQLKVFKETGSLNAVVDYMIEETKYGL
jgi:carboxylate-amine ligase